MITVGGCAAPTSGNVGGDADEAFTVSVHQSRSNVAARQLSLALTNTSEARIEITAARFRSNQFLSDAVWQKGSTTIRPGVTADLPVTLPAADCSATNPEAVVEVTYRPVADPASEVAGEGSGEGDSRTVFLTPKDPLGQLDPLFAADCLRDTAARVASIAATTAPRIVSGGERLIAELDLTITPTDDRGSLAVRAVTGTTLFTQLEPATGAPADRREVDVAVRADAPPSVLTLHLAPSRCDPHAIAEDKLGTVFPLEVEVAGGTGESGGLRTGIVSVAAADEVRALLYAFVDEACEW
jgi:hypothetical protein